MYFVREGESRVHVPGVTTICDSLPKPFLVPWAANKAAEAFRAGVEPGVIYDAEMLDALAESSRKAHSRIKQEAADKGTAVHNWLERFLKEGVEEEITEPQVANGVAAARAWLGEHKVEIIEIERRVFHRELLYAGTLDVLAIVDGVVSILDWKTSKTLHTEYYAQTAAYLMAYSHETGVQIPNRWVIRLDKESGEPEFILLGPETIATHFRVFTAALELYRAMKNADKFNKVIAKAAAA